MKMLIIFGGYGNTYERVYKDIPNDAPIHLTAYKGSNPVLEWDYMIGKKVMHNSHKLEEGQSFSLYNYSEGFHEIIMERMGKQNVKMAES